MIAFLKRILLGPTRNALRSLRKLARVAMRGNFLLSFSVAVSPKYIIAYWWVDPLVNNFGDAPNPILIEALSGRKVVHSDRVINFARRPVHYVIGSILRRVSSPNSSVWGSGFIDSGDRLNHLPRQVKAVRGPLTRRKLQELGVECPEVYGDPALLCPMFFKPSAAKRYSLGIVPHYVDYGSSLLDALRAAPSVSIVDVTSRVEDVILRITECDVIASSSLHGLIVADAYGIPSVWIKMSGKLAGDDFKFRDYFLSAGRENVNALQLTLSTSVDDLLSAAIKSARIDTAKLIDACPFAEGRAIQRLRA